MKIPWIILAALAGFSARAGELNRDFAAGRIYYEEGEFGKAAARFKVACKQDVDAEACYWAGTAYERVGDIATPFGCRANSKARELFNQAIRLDPSRPLYRRALFDFLLDDADCSRTALKEASGILSGTSPSDPEYSGMSRRLAEMRQFNGSVDARLSRLLLMVPRTTYRAAALTVALRSNRKDVREPSVQARSESQTRPASVGLPADAK